MQISFPRTANPQVAWLEKGQLEPVLAGGPTRTRLIGQSYLGTDPEPPFDWRLPGATGHLIVTAVPPHPSGKELQSSHVVPLTESPLGTKRTVPAPAFACETECGCIYIGAVRRPDRPPL
jgi:hypothetical protein